MDVEFARHDDPPRLGPAPVSVLPPIILLLGIPLIATILRARSRPVSRPATVVEWVNALPRYVTKGPRLNRAYFAIFVCELLVLVVDVASYLNRSGFLEKPWDLVRALAYLMAWAAGFGLLLAEMRTLRIAKHEVRARESMQSAAASASSSGNGTAEGSTEPAGEVSVEPKKDLPDESSDDAFGPPIPSSWRRSVVPYFLLLALIVDAYPLYTDLLPIVLPPKEHGHKPDILHLVLLLLRFALELLVSLLVFSSFFGRGRQGYQQLPDEERGPAAAKEPANYRDFWARMSLLLPFVWPKDSFKRGFPLPSCALISR